MMEIFGGCSANIKTVDPMATWTRPGRDAVRAS